MALGEMRFEDTAFARSHKTPERVKRYVGVRLSVDEKGTVRPEEILFDAKRSYPIEEVTEVKKCMAASGEPAERYTCRIGGKERYLWRGRRQWFVEAFLR